MAAEEGHVISCYTADFLNEQLQKSKESKKLVVIDFTASWCGPCRFIAPFLAELAKRLPNVLFLKQVTEDWEVDAMPTFIFLKEGTVLDKVVGAKKEELQETIAKHTATASAQ